MIRSTTALASSSESLQASTVTGTPSPRSLQRFFSRREEFLRMTVFAAARMWPVER